MAVRHVGRPLRHQVPWDYLRRASERATSVAVVLDRTAADAIVEVRGHLARMMTSRGLVGLTLFTVPESELDADGRLDPALVAPITGWLPTWPPIPARRLVMGARSTVQCATSCCAATTSPMPWTSSSRSPKQLQSGVDAGYRDGLDR